MLRHGQQTFRSTQRCGPATSDDRAQFLRDAITIIIDGREVLIGEEGGLTVWQLWILLLVLERVGSDYVSSVKRM